MKPIARSARHIESRFMHVYEQSGQVYTPVAELYPVPVYQPYCLPQGIPRGVVGTNIIVDLGFSVVCRINWGDTLTVSLHNVKSAVAVGLGSL